MKTKTTANGSLGKIAAALSLMLIATSLQACQTTEKRLNLAGAEIGAAAAGVQLAAWPDRCREQFAHASLAVGEELAVAFRNERLQLDRSNQRTRDCAAYYDAYAERLAGGN